MFKIEDDKPVLEYLSRQQLIEAWKHWARKEEIKR